LKQPDPCSYDPVTAIHNFIASSDSSIRREVRMTSAASMKDILLSTYQARVSGDVEGTLAAFADDVEFVFNARDTGSAALDSPVKGKAALRPVMQSLIDNFHITDWKAISLLAEGDKASLHWRALVTFTSSGKAAEFDVFDLVTFREGKFAVFRQSTDTAKIKALLAA
jgi:ketosteroid isomerase-like protein